jgi:multidrug efflux pump subunit AcrA (membrane-fusion protein)/YHS domain-containing protein
MKKSLYLISTLILLAVFFLAGTRFSQRGTPPDKNNTAERRILHYVDPMNPAHTTKEPGIAPCGMPMEPVYAEEGMLGGSGLTGSVLSTSPGAVNINPRKQQIIGVQLGEATSTRETHRLRALGRIRPDENLVYTLIAATDGWLEEINEATTGSLVNENQLMAQIKVFNYDFFSWQQRYLTELGYTNRLPVSTTPLAGADQSRRRVTTGAGYQAGLPISESEARMIRRGATISQMASDAEQQRMAEPPSPAADLMPGNPPPARHTRAGSQPTPGMAAATTQEPAPPSGMDHSQHMGGMTPENDESSASSRDKNLLYSSKGRLELLNFGVLENQLKELTASGSYITHVDLRSPVSGYVLERKVSSLQKIESGAECFKIADLGRVWVEVDLYDSEAKHIQPGMEARISLPKENEQFTATVSEVLPRFDAVSRSLKVRLEMDNPASLFRPDMFVDVQFLIPLPEAITVPASAVLDSGTRKTVYVVMGEGVFEPREVATGWQTSERVEITEGLQPGEKIAASGTFLIDSESRMKLAAARLMDDKTAQPAPPPVPAAAEPAPTAAPTPAPHPTMPAADMQKTTADKVKDPVCGMSVNQDQATADGLTVEVEGTPYFFCSADCKEQFEQDPQRFLTEKAEHPMSSDAPAHGGHPHD